MNGTWDSNNYAHGSIWQDTFVGGAVARPSNLPTGYVYFQRLAASLGASFDTLPTNKNIAFDEVHPRVYPSQTYESARKWAEKVSQVALVTVEWTLYPESRRVVQGLIDANNNLVKLVQQFFYFGATGDHTPDDAIDFYTSSVALHRLVPCYIVSNAWHKTELYARACSNAPGAKTAYDVSIMRRLSSLHVYDAFIWGADYIGPDEPGAARPKAVTAWDTVLASVYYRG